MSPLTWHVDNDRQSAQVSVRGRPDRQSVSRLITDLEARLAGRPGRALIDLSGVTAEGDAARLASATLPGRIAAMCGDTEMLCRSHDGNAVRGLAGTLRQHMARARRAITGKQAPGAAFTEQILPVSGGARRSRQLVTEACVTWDLPHLIGTATMVASELVSHATCHSSTLMTLVVLRRADVVYLWVRSGHPAEPTADEEFEDHLRFLVINTMAAHWGRLTADGDVVTWAALPAR